MNIIPNLARFFGRNDLCDSSREAPEVGDTLTSTTNENRVFCSSYENEGVNSTSICHVPLFKQLCELESQETILKLTQLDISEENGSVNATINAPVSSKLKGNDETSKQASYPEKENEPNSELESDSSSANFYVSDDESSNRYFSDFASPATSQDECSDANKMTSDDEDYTEFSRQISVGVQACFTSEPIRIPGRSCLGILVAERGSESDETDAEPGKLPCLTD